MPRTGTNGDSELAKALAVLINNQAQLVAQHTAFVGQQMQTADRFSRIEQELSEIKSLLVKQGRILAHHQHLIEALPEAVREKIGFKPSQP